MADNDIAIDADANTNFDDGFDDNRYDSDNASAYVADDDDASEDVRFF